MARGVEYKERQHISIDASHMLFLVMSGSGTHAALQRRHPGHMRNSRAAGTAGFVDA